MLDITISLSDLYMCTSVELARVPTCEQNNYKRYSCDASVGDRGNNRELLRIKLLLYRY